MEGGNGVGGWGAWREWVQRVAWWQGIVQKGLTSWPAAWSFPGPSGDGREGCQTLGRQPWQSISHSRMSFWQAIWPRGPDAGRLIPSGSYFMTVNCPPLDATQSL